MSDEKPEFDPEALMNQLFGGIGGGSGPTEATAAQREGCREMFNLFQTLQQGGFSEQQALHIVTQLMVAAVQS